MLNKENTINLEDFRVKDGQRVSKVFTGRDRGKYVRENSRIDEVETKYEVVNIVIPNNVYSINPSFFEEFLVNVVKKLGKEEFLKKFKFTSQGDYEYSNPLNQAIDRILKNQTALD
jgi:hypothetical protein